MTPRSCSTMCSSNERRRHVPTALGILSITVVFNSCAAPSKHVERAVWHDESGAIPIQLTPEAAGDLGSLVASATQGATEPVSLIVTDEQMERLFDDGALEVWMNPAVYLGSARPRSHLVLPLPMDRAPRRLMVIAAADEGGWLAPMANPDGKEIGRALQAWVARALHRGGL
jgi:hypothetical protein